MSDVIEQRADSTAVAIGRYSMVANIIVGGAAAIAVVHLVLLALDQGAVWVHPSFYVDILRQSVVNGLDFDTRDFLSMFVQRVDNEVRARFLNYLFMAWDQKLRLALYSYFPVHPSFMPITGALYVIAAPAMLFNAVSTVTRNARAATATVAIYLSSIGFLSCFAMNFMPAKPLSTVGYITTIWLAGRIDRAARPGQLLMETAGRAKWGLLALLVAGFYVDELMFFAWFLPPVLFPGRFLAEMQLPAERMRAIRNTALYSLPIILFAVSVLTVVPYITRSYFGWEFNYYGFNANLSNQISYGGEYPAGLEPDRAFISWAFFSNFRNLIEISTLSWPYTVSLFSGPAGTGLYSLGEVPLVLTLAAVGGLVALDRALLGGASWRTSWLIRVWIATVLYIAFLTILQLKHVPVVIGYNYGAGFAVFFSLLLGGTIALMCQHGSAWPVLGAALALYLVLVQLSNFQPLNRNWDRAHRTWVADLIDPGRHPFPRHPIRVNRERDASPEERRAIWEAWKEQRLPAYLRKRDVSVNLLSIVYELEEIDAIRRPAE